MAVGLGLGLVSVKFAHLEAIGACTQQELYTRDVWSRHLEVVLRK